MTRSKLALSLGILTILLVTASSDAQQGPRTVRVGWIGYGSPTGRNSPFLEAFRQGMSDLGYVEGRNLVIDARWMEGTVERVPEFAADLIRSKVAVIVAQGPATLGLKRATGATPVVFGFSGDPVEAGVVASMARPGGNMTGMSFLSLELVGKRLELLKEAFPGLTRVAILANPLHPGYRGELRTSEEAARRLGIMVQHFQVRGAKDYEEAFEGMTRSGSEAILAFPDATVIDQSEAIAAYAARRRIPSISGWSEFARRGNLMTYGPNLRQSFHYLATYVDKVIKGAKPAELPVELPNRIELVINLRTAKALGRAIPQSLLLRVDEVIQ
jgi:putative ABC transport system substrate-binding protein